MTEARRELVLPLVVRIERDDPPTRTDALEAAARAVLFMLVTDEPEWAPAVAEWDGYRIRKVVRRARGAEWRRALALPGLTVARGSAEVRVYPPIGLDEWPRDLAKLQVEGTDLDDVGAVPPAAAGVVQILLNPRIEMTAGKAMAQAGHAAQLGYRAAAAPQRTRWREADFDLAVRVAGQAQWDAALAAGVPVVQDAGFTEVAPGTCTAAVVLPPD